MLQDIAHFMTSISSTRSVRKEGLQHLYKQLHQNKAQLSELTGTSNHITVYHCHRFSIAKHSCQS